MSITAKGLANAARTEARDALARCQTLQEILGVDGEADPEAAAKALIFREDAGEDLAPPYVLLHCVPQPTEHVADGVRFCAFRIEAEIWIPQDVDAVTDDEDFVLASNLDQVVTELWDQHDDGTLTLFDLTACGSEEPVRDDDTGANAGECGNQVVLQLECQDG